MITETECAVETCLTAPATLRPVPLCTVHGIETALTVLPLTLTSALTRETSAGETGHRETGAGETAGRESETRYSPPRYAAKSPANLSTSSRPAQDHQRDVREEVGRIYRLIDAEGWNAVNLDRATQVLQIPERTAARRLAEARKRYAAEITRRSRR